jgi:predicted regulator of Ras-like GTPase activity (Roadblock/LC7/MglB family)
MVEHGGTGVSHALRALAHKEAEAIAQDVSGVRAVVIATGDGFEIATAARAPVDATRIAALASSMSAIGAVVSSEAGLGRSTCVTVGTDSGFAVVYAAKNGNVDLVIHVIAGPDALLGQVNYRTAAAARALGTA